MRSLLLPLLFLSLGQALLAQQGIYDETRVPFRREIYGGVMVHGDGWGLNFYYAKHRDAIDRTLYGMEVVGMKHPKEVKSFNPYYEDSRGYFYGKQQRVADRAAHLRAQVADHRQDPAFRCGGELHLGHGAIPGFG